MNSFYFAGVEILIRLLSLTFWEKLIFDVSWNIRMYPTVVTVADIDIFRILKIFFKNSKFSSKIINNLVKFLRSITIK